MKKVAFFFMIACFSFTALQATAQAQKYVETARIKTSVEKCPICKKLIEDYFKREPGIRYINVNSHNKIVTVRYFSDRTNLSNIRTAIANLGFDADTVQANQEAYNRLPMCCKRGGAEELKKEADEQKKEKGKKP